MIYIVWSHRLLEYQYIFIEHSFWRAYDFRIRHVFLHLLWSKDAGVLADCSNVKLFAYAAKVMREISPSKNERKHCRHFIKLVFIFTTREGTSVKFLPLCAVKRTKLARRNVPVIRWWILLYLSVNITAFYRHIVMSFTRMCAKVATKVTKINRPGITFLKP